MAMGAVDGFRRRVKDQRVAAGLGLGGHGGLDLGQDFFAHPLALFAQRGLRLAFILVNGRAAILQLLQLVGGGLFAAVAFVGGNGLVVGLLPKAADNRRCPFSNRPSCSCHPCRAGWRVPGWRPGPVWSCNNCRTACRKSTVAILVCARAEPPKKVISKTTGKIVRKIFFMGTGKQNPPAKPNQKSRGGVKIYAAGKTRSALCRRGRVTMCSPLVEQPAAAGRTARIGGGRSC